MSDFNQAARGLALARAADAMLRALGAGEVRVRVPTSTEPAGTARELGLTGPLIEDLTLAPALVRPAASSGEMTPRRLELLLTPGALAPHLARRDQSAEDFFAAALGVLDPAAPPPLPGAEDQARLLHVESVATESFASAAYLYRVTVAE